MQSPTGEYRIWSSFAHLSLNLLVFTSAAIQSGVNASLTREIAPNTDKNDCKVTL